MTLLRATVQQGDFYGIHQRSESSGGRVAAVRRHVLVNRDGTIHSVHVGILTRDEMTDVLSELADS